VSRASATGTGTGTGTATAREIWLCQTSKCRRSRHNSFTRKPTANLQIRLRTLRIAADRAITSR
jgi:hypothetical protein